MPTLAVSNRMQLAYIQETTFGVVPGAGNGRNLRTTGESLNFDINTDSSKEIRSDRQVGGATLVDATSAGAINFHLQYAEYETLMAGVMQNTWAVYGTNGVGTTFSATFATGTITAGAAPVGSSDFTTLKKGQWIKVNAPSNANDGKIVRISTSTAPTTTVITLDASTPLTAGGPVAGSSVAAARLTNGTTQLSFTIEKQFGDVVQFFTYRGMTANKLSLNFASASITSGSFEFVGKDLMTPTVTTALPGTATASYTYDIQNAVRGVGQLWENGAPVASTYVKSLALSVNNNLRGQKALANLGNVGVGTGTFEATGTLEVYFADATIFNRFMANTYTSLVVSSQDLASGLGNGYVLSMPRVLLTAAKITAQGQNQDMMVSFTFQAFSDDANADSTLRKTLFIDRVGVAVT